MFGDAGALDISADGTSDQSARRARHYRPDTGPDGCARDMPFASPADGTDCRAPSARENISRTTGCPALPPTTSAS